jgi:hypothetical protein
MKVEELKEAVERVQRVHGGEPASGVHGCAHGAWKHAADTERIAASFTDPSPITRERLEELGFDDFPQKESSIHLRFMLSATYALDMENGGDESPWRAYVRQPRARGGWARDAMIADPQPQTMGDLHFLLWRLTRTEGAKP